MTLNKFGSKCRQSIILVFCPAIFDRYVLALDISCLFQSLAERAQTDGVLSGDALLRKPITGSDCCARTPSGHVAAATPINEMNSRRLIASPEAQDKASYRLKVAHRKGGVAYSAMSALGHKQTCAAQKSTSALGQ